MAQESLVDKGLLIVEPSPLTLGRPLWTRNRPDAETSTWQHSQQTDRHPCPQWDSKQQFQAARGHRPTP